MMNAPIVDEVRRIRDEHAAKFNYDLEAIFQDIKEQERKSGRTYVSYAASPIESNRPAPSPDEMLVVFDECEQSGLQNLDGS